MTNRTSPKESQSKKLLADGMLGRLARWLRILGYDTVFDAQADDWALIRRARAEGRLLLTRDRQLAARRGVPALLIKGEELVAQLRQVVDAVGPSPEGVYTRCSVCNGILLPLEREKARLRVPPYVYRTCQEFHLCQSCDRVYWRGTHVKGIKEIIDKVRDKSTEKKR